MTTDPLADLPPGRRAYEQARSLRRAKRRHLLKGVTARPAAVVLPFPKKEASDAHQIDQA